MRRILVLLLFLFPFLSMSAQNLIGKKRQEVEKLVKLMYPSMVIDRTTINHTYKYLKYINNVGEETFLVFLSDKDVCTATKLISTYSNLLEVRKELNKKYKPAGKDTWKYTENGIKHLVKLSREEWFFTVFTK